MKLADYIQEARVREEHGDKQAQPDIARRVREALYEQVPVEHIAHLAALGTTKARTELGAQVHQILLSMGQKALSGHERERIVEEVLDSVLGYGPLEPLLADPSVTEIMVNGPSSVFFEREGTIYESDERFVSEEQLRSVVDKIISPLGRRVDELSPIVNARMPQGHRVNVVIEPLSLVGTVVTIRKFRSVSFTLDELVGLGSLSPELAQLLFWAVRCRKNIAVSGGTGGGKTTLLNALSRAIPPTERIVTIEDSAELRFDTHPHVVSLEARAANAEGKGEITIRDLVVNSLRMRPDRIVVGEVRGAEAADMLQAMITGHDGSLTTLHANSPAEVVTRLITMVRYGADLPVEAIQAQIAAALDIVVQQDRQADGSRRVTQLVMRNPAYSQYESSREPLFVPIVQWRRTRGRYRWLAVPSWVLDLADAGIASQEEVDAWVRSVQCC